MSLVSSKVKCPCLPENVGQTSSKYLLVCDVRIIWTMQTMSLRKQSEQKGYQNRLI